MPIKRIQWFHLLRLSDLPEVLHNSCNTHLWFALYDCAAHRLWAYITGKLFVLMYNCLLAFLRYYNNHFLACFTINWWKIITNTLCIRSFSTSFVSVMKHSDATWSSNTPTFQLTTACRVHLTCALPPSPQWKGVSNLLTCSPPNLLSGKVLCLAKLW